MPNLSTNCTSTFLHWFETSPVSHKILILGCLFFSVLMQTKFFILVGNQANCEKDVGKPKIC